MRIPGFFPDTSLKEFKVKNVNLSTTETELIADVSPLEGRKTLLIVNDGSILVYVKDETPFNISDSIVVFSGEVINITLDPLYYKPFYAKLEEGSTTIRIYEIK